MKTAEITRVKSLRLQSPIVGEPLPPFQAPSALGFFMETWRKGGIRAVNKGVNAVSLVLSISRRRDAY